jgi:hypothetical protein
MLSSNLNHNTGYPESLSSLPLSFPVNALMVPKSDHHCFFPILCISSVITPLMLYSLKYRYFSIYYDSCFWSHKLKQISLWASLVLFLFHCEVFRYMLSPSAVMLSIRITNPSSHCLCKSILNETWKVTFNVAVMGKYDLTSRMILLPFLPPLTVDVD